MAVTEIPTRGIPAQARPEEIYAAPKPSSKQVWAICAYMGDPLEKCKGCPEWEEDDRGKHQRMCFGLASEACRAVFALAEKKATP